MDRASVQEPGGSFFYQPDFLNTLGANRIDEFVESFAAQPPSALLSLAPPIADGTIVVGRMEGRWGWPVWGGSSAVLGDPIPPILQELMNAVSQRLSAEALLWKQDECEPRSFTSVYVDRYPPGGNFVPHVDRSIYGPVIAGVSLGPGSCRLAFSTYGETTYERHIAPRSLYAFTGMLRQAPCTHLVDQIDDRRTSVTFRFAADHLDDRDQR